MGKKKNTTKERLQYWFDERMSKGTISLIKFLFIGTLAVILVVSAVISIIQKANGHDFGLIIWDNIAYAFNGWIPFTDEYSEYQMLLPIALVSVVGILFTSVLIGIIVSAIESKINQLRRGTSLVLENNHIVVLGFTPGEYTLISELIDSAAGNRTVIVVAGDTEKDEMEDLIHSNIDIPRNAKIICRNVNICDPKAIKCCSLPDCKAIVINPADDEITIKAILASLSVLHGNEKSNIKIVATIKSDYSMLPKHMLKHKNIIMLQTRDIIARLIARSCTQHGVAGLFDEIFDFKGSEFYVDYFENTVGRTFGELMASITEAVPVGLIKDTHTYVRPGKDMVVNAEDKLIYLAENRKAISFDFDHPACDIKNVHEISGETIQQITVFGYNETFDTLIRELPKSIDEIILVDSPFDKDFIREGRAITVYKGDIRDEEAIKHLISDKEHLVLLNSHVQDEYEDRDYSNILRLMKLRDYKGHYKYHYTITAEMISESSRRLVESADPTDYVVASNISSMILAQIVENPELVSFLREILSNEGNEIFLKSQSQLNISLGKYNVCEMRMMLYSMGYVFLGYSDNLYTTGLVMNPKNDISIEVTENTLFAVIGEE